MLMLSHLSHCLNHDNYRVYICGDLVENIEVDVDDVVKIQTDQSEEYTLKDQDLEPAPRAKSNAMWYTVEKLDGTIITIRVTVEETAPEDEFLMLINRPK